MGRGRREKSEFGTYLVQAIKDARRSFIRLLESRNRTSMIF